LREQTGRHTELRDVEALAGRVISFGLVVEAETTAAPAGSVTVPVIEPVICCASNAAALSSAQAASRVMSGDRNRVVGILLIP
jgi:hypothetical protein